MEMACARRRPVFYLGYHYTRQPPADTGSTPAVPARPPADIVRPPADIGHLPADIVRPPADYAVSFVVP